MFISICFFTQHIVGFVYVYFFYIFVRVTQTETSQQIYGQLTTLISPLESCNRYEAVSLSHTSLKSVLRFLWAFFFNCDLLFQMSRRVWIARINWPKYNQSKWLQLSWRWLHTNLKPTYAETCGWLQLCFVYAFLFSVCISFGAEKLPNIKRAPC